MNKKYIIQKNKEILDIIKTGNKNFFRFFIIYRKKNQLTYSRFCISISKKIGNAVTRNKLKRQVKDIIMKNMLSINEDYVIILNSALKELSYEDKKSEILKGIQ